MFQLVLSLGLKCAKNKCFYFIKNIWKNIFGKKIPRKKNSLQKKISTQYEYIMGYDEHGAPQKIHDRQTNLA